MKKTIMHRQGNAIEIHELTRKGEFRTYGTAEKGVPLIGYIRVSTDKQGESGLGLEAQQDAIRDHAKRTNATVVAEYREVETGKRADRPELAKAIRHAKRAKGILVVAKLDRLARNVAFTAALLESKVKFVCCDMPNANETTIQLYAVMAEDESRRISQRTKDALKVYKARGGLLGASRPECRKLTPEARAKGVLKSAKVRRQEVIELFADLLPIAQDMRAQGATLQTIASFLNDAGHSTRLGADWSPVQVKRMLDRA